MIRLTTRSTLTDTLFPYTTLFRSCHDRQRRRIPAQGAHRLPGLQLPPSAAPAAAQAAAARPLQVRIAQGAALVWHLLPRRGNSGGRWLAAVAWAGPGGGRDRKSTRLNSSH